MYTIPFATAGDELIPPVVETVQTAASVETFATPTADSNGCAPVCAASPRNCTQHPLRLNTSTTGIQIRRTLPPEARREEVDRTYSRGTIKTDRTSSGSPRTRPPATDRALHDTHNHSPCSLTGMNRRLVCGRRWLWVSARSVR